MFNTGIIFLILIYHSLCVEYFNVSTTFTIKQSIENLRSLSKNYRKDAFFNEWAESGAVVLPNKKLVICSYPKAGTTTTKWILLALLGYDKNAICDAKNNRNVQFNHAQYKYRGLLYLRDRFPVNAAHQGSAKQGWFNDNYLGPNITGLSSLDYNWMAAEYFLDPSWTTIAFVRDPWYRSISMFHHQLKVLKNLPSDWKFESRMHFADFVANFTTHKIGHAGRSHTGDATTFCGMKYVKYDIYVDIDNITSGLETIIEKRPDFREVLTKGWENCTIHGKGSLLDDQSSQDHATLEFGAKNEKLVSYDKLFCEETLTDLVYERFRNDYLAFENNTYFTKHTNCLAIGNTSYYDELNQVRLKLEYREKSQKHLLKQIEAEYDFSLFNYSDYEQPDINTTSLEELQKINILLQNKLNSIEEELRIKRNILNL